MARSLASQQRPQRGSVLIFTCVGLVILAMCLLIGWSFSGLYFAHNRLQTSADEIALTGAKKLNEKDRIGQMNAMIARCRQLVYASRDDSNDVKKQFPEIQKFSDQLMDEARQSASDLESERKKLRAIAEQEAVQAMHDKFDSIKGTYPMTLPWLKVRSPRVISVGLGRVDGVESNVEEFTKFDKLKQSDRDQDYTAVFNKISLYKAARNEKLKDDDTDLPFFLTSIPAPIQSSVSPARTMLPEVYREADDELVPTATKVMLDLRVENGLGPKTAQRMTATGTAITAGASNPN
jgi:hypothetical protein